MICDNMLMLQVHLLPNRIKIIFWQYANVGSTFIPLCLRFNHYKKQGKHIV